MDAKKVKDVGVIEYTYFSYKQGLGIADKVNRYFKKNDAILVKGRGEISSKIIKADNAPSEWLYHLKDTTLIVEFEPRLEKTKSKSYMEIMFVAAGKNTKNILNDLQTILDQY